MVHSGAHALAAGLPHGAGGTACCCPPIGAMLLLVTPSSCSAHLFSPQTAPRQPVAPNAAQSPMRAACARPSACRPWLPRRSARPAQRYRAAQLARPVAAAAPPGGEGGNSGGRGGELMKSADASKQNSTPAPVSGPGG